VPPEVAPTLSSLPVFSAVFHLTTMSTSPAAIKFYEWVLTEQLVGKYFGLAVMTVVLYDSILTFDDEVDNPKHNLPIKLT